MLTASIAVLSIFASAQQAAKKEEIFDPKRDAAADLAAAIKKATKEKKPILVDVGGNWCGWCHKLDKLFKEDKEIGKMLKSYVMLKINYSQDNENKAVLGKFPKISGYPHIFVLDSAGKLVHSQDTGLLETGDHHDPAKVKEFLKKWSKPSTSR
jgi:thiol:disulfide interchange protein